MSDNHVDLFSLGTWVVLLALITAVVGAGVGFGCTRKARLSGLPLRRWIWLGGGALSIGGIAVWLVQLILMVGFTVSGTKMRYSPLWVALSFVLAVGLTLAGLFVVGRRRDDSVNTGLDVDDESATADTRDNRELLKVVAGGVLIGIAAAVSHFTLVRAVHVQGTVSFSTALTVEGVVIGVVLCTLATWLSLGMSGRWARFGAAILVAVGVVGMYLVAMMAVSVSVDESIGEPSGLEIFSLLFPVFIVGTLVLTVPITALLMAPNRADAKLEEEAERWAAEEYADRVGVPIG